MPPCGVLGVIGFGGYSFVFFVLIVEGVACLPYIVVSFVRFRAEFVWQVFVFFLVFVFCLVMISFFGFFCCFLFINVYFKCLLVLA